jgi:hypothetical protein
MIYDSRNLEISACDHSLLLPRVDEADDTYIACFQVLALLQFLYICTHHSDHTMEEDVFPT